MSLNSKTTLKIVGATLYWAEGRKPYRDKRGWMQYPVALTNSDPEVIKTFTKFLREIIGIKNKNLRGWLQVYPDLDKTKCEKFWSKLSGIPTKQFHKTYLAKHGKHKPKFNYGTFAVIYNRKEVSQKIFNIIEEIKSETLNGAR